MKDLGTPDKIDKFAGADFFIDGGTMDLRAPSYVKRPMDDELLGRLVRGEFCFVLTPRQMGKSSLMYRTADRLEKEGVRTVKIDLNEIGSVALEVDQWYLGLLNQIRRTLKLPVDEIAWWDERKAMSNVVRFLEFLEEVLLGTIKGRVVIFIDEIDYMLKLDFRDDFFAAIRAVYNHRSDRTAFQRLTFAMLGVAAPTELIKDKNITPFNIGYGIALQEFSLEDANVLRQGLQVLHPIQGEQIFRRIYDWTGGHPYLTQRLCKAVAEEPQKDWNDAEVDLLVERLFLKEEARTNDNNLRFVQDRILSSPQRSQLLSIYRKVISGRAVHDDGQSIVQNQLKLSGLVEVEDGRLQVRNRIYGRAFNRAWARKNMPTPWPTVAAVIAGVLALAAVVILLYDGVLVGAQVESRMREFPQADRPPARLGALAGVIRARGLILPSDYDPQAIDKFYSLTRDEQLALFPAQDCGQVKLQDIRFVILEISKTLADVEETGETTPLLEAMVGSLKCLENENGTGAGGPADLQTIQNLSVMLDNWLRGRKLAPRPSTMEDAAYLDRADRPYRQAIAANQMLSGPGQYNPSLLYEHARLLARIYTRDLASGQPADAQLSGDALDELERIWGLALSRKAPAATASPTSVSVTASSISTVSTAARVPQATSGPTPTRRPTNTPRTTEKPTEGIMGPPGAIQPTPTDTEIPTPTPLPERITSEFRTSGDWQSWVRKLLADNYGLWLALSRAAKDRYPNLNKAGLYIAPTVTPTLTNTPTAGVLALEPGTPSPVFTVTAYVSPTATPWCPGAPTPLPLKMGDEAKVLVDRLNVHETGLYTGVNQIGQLLYGTKFQLISEPVCVVGGQTRSTVIMWQIQVDQNEIKFTDGSSIGWVVEGDNGLYYIGSSGNSTLRTLTPLSTTIPAVRVFTLKTNTDRPGMDYANLAAASARACSSLCMKDGSCQSFTFVEPASGLKTAGLCYLKSGIPDQVLNPCCTSGAQIRDTKFAPFDNAWSFLYWPVANAIITQNFGDNPEYYKDLGWPGNEGLDFFANLGDPVYAAADGVVSMAEQPKGDAYGRQVRIQHVANGQEFETIYAHLNETLVQAGDTVKAGELIGRAGASGNVTGPMLHFVLKFVGAQTPGYPDGIVDPLPYLEMTSRIVQ